MLGLYSQHALFWIFSKGASMKLRYIFESVSLENEIILVPVGEGSSKVQGVIKLNKEGLEILNLLKEDTTKNAIINYLADKYENDREELSGWVSKIIDVLIGADLIDNI